MRILILNGPPNSGKDTLADNLIENDIDDWIKLSFKDALYVKTAAFYRVDLQWFKIMATNRDTKEMKLTELGHISPREAMIFVSERNIKPIYGNDYFGKEMRYMIDGCAVENIIIPDGGFEEEVQVLMDAYPEQVWIVQLKAKDCDFSNDSRDYIMGWPEQTFEIDICRGYPEMDLEELYGILNDIEDIEVARSRIYDEPDDTPYVAEDDQYEGEYI